MAALILATGGCSASMLPLAKALADLPLAPAEVEHIRGHWSISYCPDNTCDSLVISDSIEKEEALRVAVAYFTYFSQYEYLTDWRADVMKDPSLSAELGRYCEFHICEDGETRETIRRRLLVLARNKRISFFFVRFDEGHRVRSVLRPAEVLR